MRQKVRNEKEAGKPKRLPARPMGLVLSAICFGGIIWKRSRPSVLLLELLTALFLVWLLLKEKQPEREEAKTPLRLRCELAVVSFLGLGYLAKRFASRWYDTSGTWRIAEALHFAPFVLLLCIGGLLAAGAFWFVFCLLEQLTRQVERYNTMYRRENEPEHKPEHKNEQETLKIRPGGTRAAVAVCAVTAFGTITVCSKSSFLYPLNDWVDANCFFTVGKAMFNGVVVYRDLWEQKGPLLYVLHGLAWLVSHNTFLGVYLLELVAAFFFLWYSYKTMRLYCEEHCLVLVPILACIVYSSTAFCHGDSAEELCLPFFAYGIWLVLRAMEQGKDLSAAECWGIGVMAGCVFWIKFTLVGFYIGWFLVPAYRLLKNRRFKKLWAMVAQIAGGVLLATLPFVLYFGANHAIRDWLEVYLYDNIFLYQTGTQGNVVLRIVRNLIHGRGSAKNDFMMGMLMALLGCLWAALTQKKKTAAQIVCMVSGSFIFAYVGGQAMTYYALVLAAYVPFGLIFLFQLFAQENGIRVLLQNRGCRAAVLALSVAAALYLTPNRYLMQYEKQDMPQYQFAQIIRQKENATLLNYGFLDGGFYTVAEIVPNCKAFCQLNLPLAEMYETQQYYAENGLCDFIVSRNRELNFEKYALVAESSLYFEGSVWTYRLYELQS
jgi:hypothetical protein